MTLDLRDVGGTDWILVMAVDCYSKDALGLNVLVVDLVGDLY